MRDDEDRADHGQGDSDAAAEAFAQLEAKIEQMRGEVAMMRRAVESVAAERISIDVPDYSETLGELQRDVNTAAENIARIGQFLKQAPALAMTPEQLAQRITAAGATARREDQAALATAKKGLEDVTRQLHGYVVSGRTGDEQNRWLRWTAGIGIIVGIALWAAFGGALLRATPDSWRWPEHAAARTLGGSTWEGVRRLAASDSPDAWNAMVAGAVIGRGNDEALQRCQGAANKAGEPVRCTVRIRPEER